MTWNVLKMPLKPNQPSVKNLSLYSEHQTHHKKKLEEASTHISAKTHAAMF